MRTSRDNMAVKTVVNKLKRGNISLKHKLQRREGAWSKKTKDLLIDSLIRSWLVNPIYTVEDGKQCAIDGVQRLSTIRDYLADGFALSKENKSVIIDGVEYELAGKKYSKLDNVVKDKLDSTQVTIFDILEYTDDEVREMFKRLNSGVPLNTLQKLMPEMSEKLSDAIYDIISLPFFETRLTKAQLKASTDQNIALETLMLCDANEEYTAKSFRKADKENFVKYYNDKVDMTLVEVIKEGISKLDESLAEDVKIPKTTFSVLCYASYIAVNEGKDYNVFIERVNDFLNNYDNNLDYKENLNDGTTSSNSVQYRINYWQGIVSSIL